MTATQRTLLTLGLVLLFTPLIAFGLDQADLWPAPDPLSVSVSLGSLGVVLLALSQRGSWGGILGALVAGGLVLALQVYGIAFLVLQTSDAV
mgnify:CR=1 FL=1